MNKSYILIVFASLQSCTLSGGIGVHDTSLDSHMVEDNVVGWVQGEVHMSDNISLYARHESMPSINEGATTHGGYGLNTIGVFGKIEILK